MPKRAQSKAKTQGLVTLAELARSIEIHGDSGALAPKLAKVQGIIEHAGISILATQGSARAEDAAAAFAAPDDWAVSLLDADGIRRFAADEKALTARVAEEQARKIASTRYTLEDAAQALYAQAGDAKDFLPEIRDMTEKLKLAAESGELPVYAPGWNAKYVYRGRAVREWYEEVYAKDVNDWLAKSEDRIYDKLPETPPLEFRSVHHDPAAETWVTPDQLVEAFGKAAGVKKDWFTNLKGRPKLADCRMVPGNRGRPPLYCPYRFLRYLLESTHRGGKELREEDGWQRLESNFKASYRLHAHRRQSNDDR